MMVKNVCIKSTKEELIIPGNNDTNKEELVFPMTDKSTTNTNNTPQTETAAEMTKPSLSKRQSSINDVDAAEILVDISTSGVAAFTGGYQDNPGDDTQENGEPAIEKHETTTSTTTQSKSSTETSMNTLQKDTSNKLDNSSEECLNTNVSDESAVEDTTTSPTTRKVNVDMSDLVSASEKIIGPTLSGDEGTPADDALGCEGTSPTVVKETEKVL